MLKQTVIFLSLIHFLICEDYYLLIGDKKFPFILEDNKAANKLKEKLSIKIKMNGSISHEKYYKFSDSFETNIYSPRTIEVGDILLYKDDHLVLFYETFSSTYSYTRLGKVSSTDGLKEALGSGDVTVSWCKGDCSDIKDNAIYFRYNLFLILILILLFWLLFIDKIGTLI